MKIVGSNLAETISKNERALFINFYSESCESCVLAHENFQKLQQVIAGKMDVLLAEINVDRNDVPQYDVSKMPTAILFLRGKSEGIPYHGDFTPLSLLLFLE